MSIEEQSHESGDPGQMQDDAGQQWAQPELVKETEVSLIRMFFVLPEPLGLPDRYQIAELVGDRPSDPRREDDPLVSLIFHQAESTTGRTSAATQALWLATQRAGGIPDADENTDAPAIGSQHTIVEAVTTADSPDEVPEEDRDSPARWAPRADPFARSLRLAQDVARAYRHATEALCGVPTYARVPAMVLTWNAVGVRRDFESEDGPIWVMGPTEAWRDGGTLMLDHLNLPDAFASDDFTDDVHPIFEYWLNERGYNYPLYLGRDRFMEARRALWVEGDPARAVILANTSCEVTLDAILAVAMWEEKLAVADAALSFEEGKTLRRIARDLAPRLGGTWSTSSGPVGAWVNDLYRVRHRVIHAGYTPTVAQGETALQVANDLTRFAMDRLANRRSQYPRAALLAIGERGLKKRGMWAGKIKQFAEQVGPTEPSWRESFSEYYERLVDELAP